MQRAVFCGLEAEEEGHEVPATVCLSESLV